VGQPWEGNVRELEKVLRRAVLLGAPGQLALPLAQPAPVAPRPEWLPLSPAQQTSLALAQTQGQVTVADVAQRVPRSTKALRGELAALVHLGMLTKAGATKGASYRLTRPWETFLSPTGLPILTVLLPGFPASLTDAGAPTA
jgi:DNA-binding NtrC family response regulator